MSTSPASSCARCGEQLPGNAVFCPACGTRAAGNQETFSRYPPSFAFATEHARRRLGQAARAFGSRARALAETAAIRSRAQSELNRLRYARLEALERRGALLARLGEAVYTEDKPGVEAATKALERLDERVAGLETQMQQLATEAEERVRKAELPVQSTEVADGPAAGSSD